jgi:hypothetical protein
MAGQPPLQIDQQGRLVIWIFKNTISDKKNGKSRHFSRFRALHG